MDANLVYVDAIDRFLDKLEGVEEPEQKRKIIGAEFIRVFEEEARKLEGIEFLAQGTIYPDILESDGVKAHHNVGGLPEDLQFELVEPLKLLYKDEVRVVGKALGLPDGMVYRQPFRALDLACGVLALSPETAWKQSANLTPFFGKSSQRTAWKEKYGSTSPSSPTSSQWVVRKVSVPLSGR